jgi:uncharacterized protein
MTQLPQGLRYLPKILVALIWSFAGFFFSLTTRVPVVISWIVLLPDWFAKIALSFVSGTGFMLFCGMLTGLVSLLLWRRSGNKFVAILLGVLIPILLLFGSFTYAMSDTQDMGFHIIQAVESGSITNTREQVLIQSQALSRSRKLIQLGVNVNARDPEGHSALYSASWEGRDPEILKLLLQSGAKPDAAALRHAISWGRLDAIQLMFNATSDDGKALIAELGSDALQANNVHTRTSEADRAKITQLLIARGAKPFKN